MPYSSANSCPLEVGTACLVSHIDQEVTYTLISHIALVSNQNLVNVLVSILLQARYPVSNVIKRRGRSNVIDQKNTHSASVIGLGDGCLVRN